MPEKRNISWPLRIFRTNRKCQKNQKFLVLNLKSHPEKDETYPMRFPLTEENKEAINKEIDDSFNGFCYFCFPMPFRLETFCPLDEESAEQCEIVFAAPTEVQRKYMQVQGFLDDVL